MKLRPISLRLIANKIAHNVKVSSLNESVIDEFKDSMKGFSLDDLKAFKEILTESISQKKSQKTASLFYVAGLSKSVVNVFKSTIRDFSLDELQELEVVLDKLISEKKA